MRLRRPLTGPLSFVFSELWHCTCVKPRAFPFLNTAELSDTDTRLMLVGPVRAPKIPLFRWQKDSLPNKIKTGCRYVEEAPRAAGYLF